MNRREKLMSLKQAAAWLSEELGVRRSKGLLYNWATAGCKGVRLEVIDLGGVLHTSAEALHRFMQNTTRQRAARTGVPLEVLKA